MKLTVFNGSPRGPRSNSTILMTHFLDGLNASGRHETDIVYLVRIRQIDDHVRAFRKAENAVLVFPLYTDAMPGIVKTFIEALSPLAGGRGNPRLGFVVQSGFPEPHHSRFVERYLEKLARRLTCIHTGTVVRGGVEGIQKMPPWMTRRLFQRFYDLGVAYGETGVFSPVLIQELVPRERLSPAVRLLYRAGGALGLTNGYWNGQLKANRAFKDRFARPYESK